MSDKNIINSPKDGCLQENMLNSMARFRLLPVKYCYKTTKHKSMLKYIYSNVYYSYTSRKLVPRFSNTWEKEHSR